MGYIQETYAGTYVETHARPNWRRSPHPMGYIQETYAGTYATFFFPFREVHLQRGESNSFTVIALKAYFSK